MGGQHDAKATDDAIERHATETACERHLEIGRGCRYDEGHPCRCRTIVVAMRRGERG